MPGMWNADAPSAHSWGHSQGLRRTQRLRASFFPRCVHQISSVNGTETCKQIMGENLCMVLTSFVISQHWQGHAGVLCSSLRRVTETSFSITGNSMCLNECLRSEYSYYLPKAISPLVSCYFSLWLFGSLLDQMWVRKILLDSTKIGLIQITELDCGSRFCVTLGILYFTAKM